MNDYKELIVHIATVMALEDECGQKELADMLENAADAIEQLVKERDAAVVDFNQFAIYAASTESFACEWCKHERGGGRCQWFTDHKDDRVCRGVHFEWRGLREDGE